MIITYELLEKNKACMDQLDMFKTKYPDGIEVTKRNYNKCLKQGFDIAWAVGNVIELTREYIRLGLDVNVKDNDGITPLHWAASNCHTEIVKLLIDHGAEVNVKDTNGITPLHLAASNGRTETVKLLKEYGAK